jgi:hypothetical protein
MAASFHLHHRQNGHRCQPSGRTQTPGVSDKKPALTPVEVDAPWNPLPQMATPVVFRSAAMALIARMQRPDGDTHQSRAREEAGPNRSRRLHINLQA